MDFSTGKMKLVAGIAVLSGAAVVTTLGAGPGTVRRRFARRTHR